MSGTENRPPRVARTGIGPVRTSAQPVPKPARCTIAGVWGEGRARCPQPGTFLMGYPPLLLPRELPNGSPSQRWITRIDPNRGQLRVT